jgi:hypothetical protein
MRKRILLSLTSMAISSKLTALKATGSVRRSAPSIWSSDRIGRGTMPPARREVGQIRAKTLPPFTTIFNCFSLIPNRFPALPAISPE